MSFLFEFIYDQIYKFLYSSLDLFLPQKRFIVLSMESGSGSRIYHELVQKTKLTFEKDYLKSTTDQRDAIINDNGYNIEFKNFLLTDVSVSSYYYSRDDLFYRYSMKGCYGYIITLDCIYDLSKSMFRHPNVSDLIEFAKVDDSKYHEKKPLVYMKKNHRPLLFILKGYNKEMVQKAVEHINNSIQNWEYENDKYYIAFHSSTYEKETIYEGLEWFFSKTSDSLF